MVANQMDPYSIDMFVESVEVVPVTERTFFCTQFSGVTAFETDDGLLLVDTSAAPIAPDIAAEIREYTSAPVDTVVYTHGHLDHAYHLDEYLLDGQDPPTIIAHEAMTDRFDRYERTPGHNVAINARQFGGAASETESLVDEGGSRFRHPEHPPTVEYRSDITIEVGGTTFEIHHARGETDDHSWVYCPDRDVLCSGDFFISVTPNAGNPQKVQRYPWAWADALREMAGREPRYLCPGHGGPVVDDPEGIQKRLLTSADYLDSIVERTIAALEDGSPPHVDIVNEIDIPEFDVPWLAEVYDEGEFIARNVVRYYGGWWSGRPSELKPAPRGALAAEVAELAGDAETLAARAEQLAEQGQFRLAGHLADYALEAAPGDEGIQSRVEAIYEQRAEDDQNLMSANIYASAAEYARQGRAFR